MLLVAIGVVSVLAFIASTYYFAILDLVQIANVEEESNGAQ